MFNLENPINRLYANELFLILINYVQYTIYYNHRRRVGGLGGRATSLTRKVVKSKKRWYWKLRIAIDQFNYSKKTKLFELIQINQFGLEIETRKTIFQNCSFTKTITVYGYTKYNYRRHYASMFLHTNACDQRASLVRIYGIMCNLRLSVKYTIETDSYKRYIYLRVHLRLLLGFPVSQKWHCNW